MQKDSIRGDEHGGLRGQPHTPPSLGERPLTVLEAPPRKGLGPLAQMILMPTCPLLSAGRHPGSVHLVCNCLYCGDSDSHRCESSFDLVTHLSSQILKGDFLFKLKTFFKVFHNGPHEVLGDSLQCDIISQGCQSVHQTPPPTGMSQPCHLQGC